MNASVYFYNPDPGFSGNGWSRGEDSHGNWDGTWYYKQLTQDQLPADGSYSLPGCPCKDLTAYLYIPANYSAPMDNGGFACFIIMQDDNGNYSGREANPSDVINWQALNMPCSPLFYNSDQPTVQSERISLDPRLNGGDYSGFAGYWQAAEARTSGSGSSG